jgi:putative phage-type endonuclease
MPKIIANTKVMSRAEWLKIRNNFIGGSDAGIVLGVNKYKTALELWLEKTGQVEIKEIENEAIHFGNVLEQIVADEFTRRTGKKVRKRNQMLQHDNHEFMMANIDREVVGEKAILECKTASLYLEKEWDGDEIPAAYLVQINHYLAVTGYEKAYIACLIGGQKFVWKEIQRDDELIKMIIQAEKEFWEQCVLGGQAPAIDGSDAAVKFVKERYSWGLDSKDIVDLKAEHNDNIEKYIQVKEILKDYETEKDRLENLLKMDLGEYQAGTVGKWAVTWKNSSRAGIDSTKLKEKYPEIYKEVETKILSRRFTIKGAK